MPLVIVVTRVFLVNVGQMGSLGNVVSMGQMAYLVLTANLVQLDMVVIAVRLERQEQTAQLVPMVSTVVMALTVQKVTPVHLVVMVTLAQ